MNWSNVKTGKSTSCGCSRRKDLTGQKFGRLTAIKLNRTENRKTYWDCICDCGNTVTVRTDQLTRGVAKSCGCLAREIAAKNCAITGKANANKPRALKEEDNLVGKVFNGITALELTDKKGNKIEEK